MINKRFQNKYLTESVRAMWHDYGNGAYFVTVCTKNREHFFGDFNYYNVVETARAIETGRAVETGRAPSLRMTEIGHFLYDNLQNVTAHYPYAEIPLFVVMPNHWHAIVYIDADKTPYNRRNAAKTGRAVETGRAPSLREITIKENMKKIDSLKGWLSVVIGGIKSAVTKFAHNYKINFEWQTRFHDHIIRNQYEMNIIADYIENNPEKWNTDCYYKDDE